ncbi:hypothetical protein GGI20_000843 [Coemansia sp. BCRC 34301]|nr:hypothetical protein GGI20_000843 [Coemansia sp. BCRC 34301]
MQLATRFGILALMSLQSGVAGVLGTAIAPLTTPMWTEAPQITKAVIASVEANLSRFVPHMLSEAKMVELAAVIQGLGHAQVHSVPTVAASDEFWDGAELDSAVSQLDDKIAELEATITAASNGAQARVSRDLKRAWESVYNALGYSATASSPVYRRRATASSPQFAHGANVPLEPGEAVRSTGISSAQPASSFSSSQADTFLIGEAEMANIATSTRCDSCEKNVTDILWVCAMCPSHHRLCNSCMNAEPSPFGGSDASSHRMIAWPIRKQTIGDGQYVVCDHCTGAVVGIRWKCAECSSFDICNDCFNQALHKHEHELKPHYYSDTAMHPRGTDGYGYTCNKCSGRISAPVLCCLQCPDYHVCTSCAGKGKLCSGHDFAAIGMPATSAAVVATTTPTTSDGQTRDGGGKKPSSSASAPHDRSYHPHQQRTGAQTQGLFSAVCNECCESIGGIRHRCTFCKDYDLCDNCYRRVTNVHPGHGFVHFGPPFKPPAHRLPLRHAMTMPHSPGQRGHHHYHGRGQDRLSRHGGMSVCRLVNPPVDSSLPLPPPPPPTSLPSARTSSPAPNIPMNWMHFTGKPCTKPLQCTLPPQPLVCPRPMGCTLPPLAPMRGCTLPSLVPQSSIATQTPTPRAEEKQQQTDAAPSAERSTSTEDVANVVHRNVVCDACNFPIVGVRYKCGNCTDFDLCESCEASVQHNKDHLFIKMRKFHATPTARPMLNAVYPPAGSWSEANQPSRPTLRSTGEAVAAVATEAVAGALAPVVAMASAVPAVAAAVAVTAPAPVAPPVPRSNSVAQSGKYVAIFVEDVTIPDGTVMAPGETFVKIWSVANMGDNEWPRNTMLVHVEGEPTIPGNKKAVPVVISKRYEQVGIAVDLVAPTVPGSYVSQWRLMTSDGQYFGTGLWCTIVVEEPVPDIAASPSASTDAGVARSVDKGKATDVASVASDHNVSPASLSRAASTASSAIHVHRETKVEEDASFMVPTATMATSPSVGGGSSSSNAFTATPNDSASVDSLSNTFVKISSDLMNEIRRLDQSIRVLQLRQDMADAASRAGSRQNQSVGGASNSMGSSVHGHNPFDITATPAGTSDVPIQAYPPSAEAASESVAAGPQQYANIDLLSSPPLNASAVSSPPQQPHSAAPSDSDSMREFYSSAARLEQLLISSRMASGSSSRNSSTLTKEDDSEDGTDEANDEFDMVNDFAHLDATSPKNV